MNKNDHARLDASAVDAASRRLADHVVRTPLDPAPALGEPHGLDVVVKCEHLQRTGSFKLRGATNALLSMDAEQRARGVVTASSGNHGAAVAHAARRLGVPATVAVPKGASRAKVAAIRREGGSVEETASPDAGDAEAWARSLAAESDRAYVPPYNDPAIVAGQATVAVELLDQLPGTGLDALDAVVVAVGGGGLISGIATYLKERAPGVAIVGVSPRNDAAMAASVAAGRIERFPASPTLSDGTAGSIEPGSITFPICASLVDHWVTVPEEEIAPGMRAMIEHQHQLVEGAAGVAVAALGAVASLLDGRRRVAVIGCGANVELATLRAVLG